MTFYIFLLQLSIQDIMALYIFIYSYDKLSLAGFFYRVTIVSIFIVVYTYTYSIDYILSRMWKI